MCTLLDSKELYRDASYTVSVDTYRLPEGKQGTTLMVHHPGGVAVLAIDQEGRIPLVRQWRCAVGKELLEVPAGKLDKIPGESPEAGAKRELREETGCVTDTLFPLGCIYPTPGIDTEVLSLFAAKVSGRGSQELDDDECVDVVWVEPAQLRAMIADGRINDAKTICIWTRAVLGGLISFS